MYHSFKDNIFNLLSLLNILLYILATHLRIFSFCRVLILYKPQLKKSSLYKYLIVHIIAFFLNKPFIYILIPLYCVLRVMIQIVFMNNIGFYVVVKIDDARFINSNLIVIIYYSYVPIKIDIVTHGMIFLALMCTNLCIKRISHY